MDVEDSKTEEEQHELNIGELLCEARDNLELDSQQIAAELNLAQSVIESIEQNIFQQEIPIAFIRGYVKSYATKVGLDTAQILSQFDLQTGLEAPSLTRVKSISKFNHKRKEMNSGSLLIKAVSVLIVLLFFSYGGWELWKRYASNDNDNSEIALGNLQGNEIILNTQTTDDSDSQSSSNGGLSEASRPDGESASLVNDKTDTVPATDSLTTQGSSSQYQNIDQSSAASPITFAPNIDTNDTALEMTSLVLDFSADCWVRIVDARGEVIAIGVKSAGKHMPVEGVKPFNVVLGDPSVVTMQYNEQAYDLSGYRAGRRAEVILN